MTFTPAFNIPNRNANANPAFSRPQFPGQGMPRGVPFGDRQSIPAITGGLGSVPEWVRGGPRFGGRTFGAGIASLTGGPGPRPFGGSGIASGIERLHPAGLQSSRNLRLPAPEDGADGMGGRRPFLDFQSRPLDRNQMSMFDQLRRMGMNRHTAEAWSQQPYFRGGR